MKTKHTPGPWSVGCVRTRESGEPVLQILGHDDKAYAFVLYSDKTHADHLASYADARLIAAAPELLASLQAVVMQINDYERVNKLAPNPGRTECWDCVAGAKEIIAKATA